jgi:hypothetical protein
MHHGFTLSHWRPTYRLVVGGLFLRLGLHVTRYNGKLALEMSLVSAKADRDSGFQF